jgi:hypothetical protein
MQKIRITAGTIEVHAKLNDTKTAQAILEALPLKEKVNTWGDEIYFPIPLKLEIEDGKEVVEPGDLGYWPEGHCFCIFFGPTPASHGKEIRAASPVTIFGKIIGDPKVLKQVTPDTEISVELE